MNPKSATESSMASSPPEMQLQRMGTALVFVQPMEDGKASGSSVMIELQSGVPCLLIHDTGGLLIALP